MTKADGCQLTTEGKLCVCFNLRKAARAVTQLYEAALRPTGLRATQLGILGAIMAFGPVTITQLAEGLVTDRTTLTRNLRLLQRKGLITEEPGPDRRQHRLVLTKKGRDVLDQVYPLWKAIQGKLTKRLGDTRVERLLADLDAVVDTVKCC
jgi:DNA-binding MarR family transcriptional regulator